MTGGEALRRFEAGLLPVRTIAGNNEAWERYRSQWLPQDPDSRGKQALTQVIHQGFDAGYDAAMAEVRRILATVQSAALHDLPEPGSRFPAAEIWPVEKRVRIGPHTYECWANRPGGVCDPDKCSCRCHKED